MEEVHFTEHSSPIKNVKQLIVVVVLAFVVPITLCVVIALLATRGSDMSGSPAMSEEAVAKRMKPAGTVVMGEARAPEVKPAPAAAPTASTPAPAAVATAASGKDVYDKNCVACHAAGVAGAPKAGDKAAWAPRIASGIDALYASSLKGKNAMPPKGGNLSLADADVKAAVDYLVGLAR
jgi:cytochrome c5